MIQTMTRGRRLPRLSVPALWSGFQAQRHTLNGPMRVTPKVAKVTMIVSFTDLIADMAGNGLVLLCHKNSL